MLIRRFDDGETLSEEDILWNPQILYHYTDMKGLKGILESREVWATNIRYLNDPTEFIYAQSTFIGKLHEIRRRVPKNNVAELDGAIGQLSILSSHYFAFCLTRARDLLSQWRAYCRPGNGCSIGFDGPVLSKIAQKGTGMKLASVCYNPREQVELMNKMEVEAVTKSKSNYPFGKALSDEFLMRAPFIKNPSYWQEDEWRLLLHLRRTSSSRVRHFTKSSNKIPYVPIKFGTKNRPLPIRIILIWPGPHSELDKETVEALCQNYNLEVEVRNSEIPYREI